MLYLSTRWFGVFLHDGKEILDCRIFPKDKIKDRIERIRKGEVLDEEMEVVRNREVFSSDKRLISIARYLEDIPDIDISPEDYGLRYSDLRKALMDISKEEVEKRMGREDLQIIQMIKNINELIRISNLLSERIREWKRLPKHEGVEAIEKLKEEIESTIKDMKKRLEEKMSNIAPNLSAILGPTLGAELISISGGLERLAKMPASSIQILGAEKALFRYKHGKGTPPKHGVIFKHHIVRSAKPKYRGKISRFLASKISMAVKADAFTKNIIHDKLKEEIEEFLSKIDKSRESFESAE